MSKKEFEPQPWLFPCPTVLIGTVCDGKPNIATYAWSGVGGGEPPVVTVAVRHQRHTLKGIYQNRAFSVNVPTEDFLVETDYCGTVSGRDTDKIKDCGFTVFYGTLKTTPLIEECPVNLECEVMHILDVGLHALVVGKVISTRVTGFCLTDGMPDISKIYSRGKPPRYNGIGKVIGEPFVTSKDMKKQPKK